MSNARPNGVIHTLPASWYHDEAVFRRERDLIFARHWALVAREAELSRPGDYVSGEVAGMPVFVIRHRDGNLRAFHNVCRHRAGPVVRKETGHCDVLRCSYHGWVYDLEGHLKKAPGYGCAEGEGSDRFNLFPLRVAVWNGLVFVCQSEDSPDLLAWLGDIVRIARDYPPIEEMTFHGTDELLGRANWKAYADNSAEGYHVPFVHRGLSKAVAGPEIAIAPYDNGQFVGFKVRYAGKDDGKAGKAFWVYKHPGLLLHFGEDTFNLERVIPLSAGTIRLVRWFWFLNGPAQDARRRTAIVAESTEVMKEDLSICEEVQRNLEAGVYQSGELAPAREAGTIFVQNLVRSELDGRL